MIHPDTELRFINDVVGYGVVAKKFIPKGTITWVQDDLDQVYTPEDIRRINPVMQTYLDTYSFTNSRGEKVLCWDHAKYVNHSFNPSCMSTAYDFEIAIRDIQPGEQLTDDYGYLNVSEPFEAEDEGTERKVVYPDDILNYYEVWDGAIKDNMANIGVVSQPLLRFIPQANWAEFSKVLSGEAPLRSIKTCYFEQKILDRS
ncbi:SET domain-containing protein-lysine N-methyltransferase [Flavobacterium cyanobacteriorum]|uniref:SET domain-containing protein-lysine N-methyltransferase n=1 Tax=Flavobacterium cyanobacteriorum TaxID=2022802 RepID=A0A255YYY0_9FLAO|nr:SET domain-containing protein [Flavobacterium cyanobacteriorum]OYQ34446.1 SET domain-containing protein-lysine N-methyltransferase [Flavobacterium cyanobacteriorum]